MNSLPMQPTVNIPSVNLLNKVPEVTLIFWIIKMMSTTVGETGADYLIFKLHLGLLVTSAIMGVLLIIALFVQVKSTTYVPWRYWTAVVFISIFGTLITDDLTDKLHVPLLLSTAAFSALLILTFLLWYSKEKTLSINAIDNRNRELFYWIAILATFALGTAAGDWVSEEMKLGYSKSAILFGGMIAITAFVYFVLHWSTVTCFWVVYILTRPLGASVGDLLSHSKKHGGLGFGTTSTSIVFLGVIIGLVVYLSIIHEKNKTSNSVSLPS